LSARPRTGKKPSAQPKKTRPDVAIIDISMPVLNGLDTARELKKSSPNTKVILLTEHDTDEYVTESLRAGAEDMC